MGIDSQFELEVLNGILNFSLPVISDKTRFWMIRTQGGYFYNEFIAKKIVALAWNHVDSHTDFSEQSKERLQDDIVLNYPNISRPSTVVNKCKNFMYEVTPKDILVIPSKGSRYVTFALAGEYFEDVSKTASLEKVVIERIKNRDVDINDVSCPYKKRRHITLLRTVRSEDINYSLYRAISNYHGISNFDNYAKQILNELYNCYIFNNDATLVYNIRKQTPIKPRELSNLIYGNTECLAMIIPEERISTQMSLSSPGDAVYTLEKVYEFAKDNWSSIFGILIFLGGGSALSFHVPGLIDIVKNILHAPDEINQKHAETELKQLEVLSKRIEVLEKIRSSGINPEDLVQPLEALSQGASSLQAEPIILGDDASAIPIEADVNEESNDIDEEL